MTSTVDRRLGVSSTSKLSKSDASAQKPLKREFGGNICRGSVTVSTRCQSWQSLLCWACSSWLVRPLRRTCAARAAQHCVCHPPPLLPAPASPKSCESSAITLPFKHRAGAVQTNLPACVTANFPRELSRARSMNLALGLSVCVSMRTNVVAVF